MLVGDLTDDQMRECADDKGHKGPEMKFYTFSVTPNKDWEVQRASIVRLARDERARGFRFCLVNKISLTELRIGFAPAIGEGYDGQGTFKPTQGKGSNSSNEAA
jgi:hypothetical protein